MLFQETFNWYNFLADIIGSIIATISAIFVWFLIDRLKKRREQKNLEKNLKKLYDIFSKNEFTDSTPAKVFDIMMNEIGDKNLLKVLKMKIKPNNTGCVFEGYPFWISIVFTKESHTLLIQKDTVNFRFGKFDEYPEVRQDFLNYFLKQCKKENITIQEIPLKSS